MYLAYKKIHFTQKSAIIAFCVSFILLFFEIAFVTFFHIARAYDMFFFLVPTSFFMFIVLKETHLTDHTIYITLRKLSSLMFYLHLLVANTVITILSRFRVLYHESLIFIVTVALTILLSLIIIRLSNMRPFKWLTKLYL